MRQWTLLCTAAFLLMTGAASATELRSGDRIVVAADEVIDDDLLAFGGTVVVKGVVNGDLMAFASRVAVPGEVKGSVMAAGQTVSLDGNSGGSARLAGQSVTVSGQTARNLAAAGQQVSVHDEATVGKDAHLAGAILTLEGKVHDGADLAGSSVVLASPVGGDVKAYCDTLTLDAGADVGGDLVYQAPQQLTMDEDARVGGSITHIEPEPRPAPDRPRRGGALPLLLGIIGFTGFLALTVFVLGVVMLAVVPRYTTDAASAVARPAWKSVLFGFLVLVVVPVAAFLVCLTLIGIPIALVALGLYGTILLLSGVPVPIALGGWLLQRLRSGRPASPYLALLVGVVVLALLALVPIVGPLVSLAVVLFGLGALSRVAKGVLVAGRATGGA